MAAGEGSGVAAGQPNLSKQDLSKLDPTKLTALSPEVISHQATINIGTIGHVAHGKSTVVKAISGVQTVRFKNELERNITIKLGSEDGLLNGKTMLMKDAVVSLQKTSIVSMKLSSLTDAKVTDPAVTKEAIPQLSCVPVVCIKKSDSDICESEGYKASVSVKCYPVNASADIMEVSEPEQTFILPDTPVSVVDSCGSSTSSDVYHKPKKRKKPVSTSKAVKKEKVAKQKTGKKEVYEVEKIVSHCEIENCVYYSVKWKGWDAKYNTWEPLDHLNNCEERLLDYFSELYGSNIDSISDDEIDKYMQSLVQLTKESFEELMATLRHNGRITYKLPNQSELRRTIALLLCIPEFGRNPETIEKVKRDAMLLELHPRRTEQLASLKEWETEINVLDTDTVPIVIENEVDLEGRPVNFTYVNDYIPGKGVTIPDEPPIGCSCGTCDGRKFCCSKQSGDSVFAYTPNRLLRVPAGTPIYECNRRCSCSKDCGNRVVQNGRQVKLSIFRTSTGCGWGVKALENIRKGAFVCEYVGEVIDNEEAEERGRKYDAEGRTYLFDLDYNEKEQCPYTVDAAVYGNISHFINHSCNPNLAVFAVWINCLDPDLPKLALFATRNIRKGEEVTFDYKCQSYKQQSPGNEEDAQLSSKTLCKCGSADCRKYLF